MATVEDRLANIADQLKEMADVATGVRHVCSHGGHHGTHVCSCDRVTSHDWQATDPACGHLLSTEQPGN